MPTIRFAITIAIVLTAARPAGAHSPPKGQAAPLKDARLLFGEVSELIRTEYVDPAHAQENVLYSDAVRGLLKALGPHDEILTPQELAWMKGSVNGALVGIGVVYEKVEGLAVVREVLPRGPAKKSRIRPGDRILQIDGVDIAGLDTMAIGDRIRGVAGTTVELLMQRGTEEWSERLERSTVEVPSVLGHLREDGVGYIQLLSFDHHVAEGVDRVLGELDGARAYVLDLRGCPGGLFKMSIEIAGRFLPIGTRVVSTRDRRGDETVYATEHKSPVGKPMVVLVNEKTASSAEILAAALRENGRALVVGEKSFGKGTVERIFELSGGYGLKLTVARFYSPKGHNWQGDGIEPDFEIPSDLEARPVYTRPTTQDADKDVQLRAALNLLELRRR